MQREAIFQRLSARREPWDLAVIGGGATGAGVALDAAARGYAVALFEQGDFGKGTSSRSTKLIHGGVRYLRQGNVALVRDSLRERGLLMWNAPHVVHGLEFIIPTYAWWETPFYGLGMKVYDWLAGRLSLGRSQVLSREDVLRRVPTLAPKGLRGGVKYHDGQFDDARLLINLVQTAAEHGAVALNYARVTDLAKDDRGHISGLTFRDEETGGTHEVAARMVINATGPFSDGVRRIDEPASSPMIEPSQGVHLVLRREFLPGDTAILVPRTRDGRVMFAIPWHGHTLVGTTDTAIPEATLEPLPREDEIEDLLEVAGEYLAKKPSRADILSVFTGIRPLVKTGEKLRTSAIARDHTIAVSGSGLLTIAGGKWTTYRKMAEDAVDRAVRLARLEERESVTWNLRIHGHRDSGDKSDAMDVYGSDRVEIDRLKERDPELSEPLHPALDVCGAQVVWAARQEFARTVEDVLARRTRALFVNAAAALAVAPAVARLLAGELERDVAWQAAQVESFRVTAETFLPPR